MIVKDMIKEVTEGASGNVRVAVYGRVCVADSVESNAIDEQIKGVLEFVKEKRNEWVFDVEKDLYVEEGVSGSSIENRTIFKEMLSKAKLGDYNIIVTRDIARFMRNAKGLLDIVDELKGCGVEVWFLNDGIKTFNKDDYFKLFIMSQYAEQESRKISERVFTRLRGV